MRAHPPVVRRAVPLPTSPGGADMRRPALAVLALVVLSSAAFAASATAWMSEPAPTRPATRPAPDDATIVAIFDAANGADIETGRLAAERGASREVRAFGAMLARDHATVRQMGRD